LLAEDAIDHVQFEFGGCNIDSRTYFRDLWDLLSPRFDLARIVANGVAPVPRYEERYEIFVTTNFVATAKRLRAAR
jgi:hypothetical protein